MRRVLEPAFRHWPAILILLALPVVIAVGIVWVQPRQYQASATLWALQRYSVIGASGPETNDLATPATTQSTALTELLQTRSFDLAVAKQTDLASTFDSATRSDSSKLDDAILQELSTKVLATANGFNLYQITYDNKSPHLALEVITAVVAQFGQVASGFSVAEANQLLQTYQTELTQAEKSANSATQAAVNYSIDHPRSTTENDSAYNQLVQAEQGAQANVANIQGQITKINQQLAVTGNGTSALYTVVDSPAVNSQAISRTKTLGLGAGIGLAVGLLIVTLLLVMLSRRDRSAYSPEDLRRITGLPVALELPQLPASVISRVETATPALPAPAGTRV